MKPYAQTLQRLLNALAFANAGNLREFEELLEESVRSCNFDDARQQQ